MRLPERGKHLYPWMMHVLSPYKRMVRKLAPQVDVTTRPAETESGTTQLTDGGAFSKEGRHGEIWFIRREVLLSTFQIF